MLRWRVDDFPGTKPDEFNKHNIFTFFRFHDVMAKHGIPDYILGVIPKHASSKDLLELSAAKIKCAIHGIDHDENFPNEFREYETREQIASKIDVVRREWKDNYKITANGYIPPHNVIDYKTIDAARSAGIGRIFTGPGTSRESLIRIWATFGKTWHSVDRLSYGRSDELIDSGAVKFLRKMSEDIAIHWVTLHFPWETNIGLSSLDRFLYEVTGG